MTAKNTSRRSQQDTPAEGDQSLSEQEAASGSDEHIESGAEQAPVEQEPRAEQDGADGAPPQGTRGGDGSADADALRDKYLRLAAEYDNYRKRTERERTESWGRAQAQLVERILDALDDLERVAGVQPESTSVAAVLEGVQMVDRKLIRLLEGAGLEVVDAEGRPFDPSVHEAIVSTPTEDESADETVAEVFQKGYSFKGNLIRPARVRVHKFEG